MDFSLDNPVISVEEMLDEKNGKLFGTSNAVFLGQNVDRVLLAVRCHDVRIVSLDIDIGKIAVQVTYQICRSSTLVKFYVKQNIVDYFDHLGDTTQQQK